MPAVDNTPRPRPGPRVTGALFALVAAAIIGSISLLLSVDDPERLKLLVEDSGPVQMIGQTAIAVAFSLGLVYVLFDSRRRTSYLMLSYLLMFYFLREADYHYEVSAYAKATQFKRFFGHDMIPFSTKLFLFTLIVLFLVVLYRYLRREKDVFILSLRRRLPWAQCVLAWSGIFCLSQLIDQIPLFHHVTGQVFEEVLEASAEVLALLAMILFRIQVRGGLRLPG